MREGLVDAGNVLQIENCKLKNANSRSSKDARTVRALFKERIQRGCASDQLPVEAASPPVFSEGQFS